MLFIDAICQVHISKSYNAQVLITVSITRCQNHLETVTLVNANLNNINFANILIACMRSKSTITSLNLHYSTYNSWRLFDSWVFTNCLEMFQNLEVLTVDCWIFLQCYNRVKIIKYFSYLAIQTNLVPNETVQTEITPPLSGRFP